MADLFDEEPAPSVGLHIPLDGGPWEIIVADDGTILLATMHGPDRYMLDVGCLGCAGVPSGEALAEGIDVIRYAGRQPGQKPN